MKKRALAAAGLIWVCVLAQLSVSAATPPSNDTLAPSGATRAPSGGGTGTGAAVSIWMTTGDHQQLLTPQSATNFGRDTGKNPLTIDVTPSTRYQQMDGFGASFTDSSAWLVANTLGSSARTQLMMQLFDPQAGIGLSYLRQPMGASDFALTDYTYDDMPAGQTDPALSSFSIAHDQAYILPVLQQALQINPQIRVIAVPWSAPAWMKASQSLFAGSLNTDPTTMTAFANYFVKFIQQYTTAGVPIDRVAPQNEPLNENSTYPTMYMDAATQASFISGYLGPAIAAAALPTHIAAYDHNWDNTAYPETVLGSTAGSYTSGSAWHCYAGAPSAMATVHNAYPSKDVYLTECSGGTWATNFGSNLVWDLENLIIGGARNWARTITKWNLVLDSNSGPHLGGCSNCTGLVTIDRTVSPAVVSFNYDYYALGHISKFVQPGAYRVASNTFGSGSIEDVAFVNPNGSTALIVLNSATTAKTFKVRQGTQSFTYSLPAGAVATFVW